MARDKITVDLMLATKQAEREIARINRKVGDLGKTMGKAFGGTGAGGDKVRALGTGLSKATVKADEFSKSMEASNARVIAFGASAGLIMGIDRALKAMVASAIKVEKAMMDVNIVMNATTQQLDKFGKGMFKVAKDTAQGFDTVSEAATELARQGLGMEKTLARTKDALILTRLTGMNAADSVKSLTAAVNSFNKEGVTSAQVINRMAKVDAKFAVSSEDLAKSISRVGASAVSAGVSMNELMAITTAVQQRTARGGAVIGNAFKTIFTRIQRSDVQKRLRDLGVATRDMQGNMLSGIQVLQNLSKEFNTLSKAQRSSIAENVAGVFQVNILKAALSDLSQETSQYSGALRAANSATDEAYQKNERLNQTLDSLVNRTMANLTQAGASLGGGLFGPAIENTLGLVNSAIEAFGDKGSVNEVGKSMGKHLVAGIGSFIGGPGLALITAVFGKIAMSLGRFASTALKDVLGLNEATRQRAALEQAVAAHIASEPALLAKVRSGTLGVLSAEQEILATIRLSNAERSRIAAYAAPMARSLVGRGVRVGSKGTILAPPGGASGFVPNFASAGSERAAAAAGGYRAGGIRTMRQPGVGTMMYNSAETVKRFSGMSQSAIMPPKRSPAGAGYKAAFGAAHGFDPYAAGGFVPNFAVRSFGLRHTGYANRPAMYTQKNKPLTKDQKAGALTRGGHLTVPGGNIAMLVPQGQRTGMMKGRGEGKYSKFTAQFPVLSYSEGFLKQKYPKEPERVDELMKAAAADVTRQFAASIKPPARTPGKREVVRALENTAGARGAFQSAAGASFEVGMDLALDKGAAAQEQRFGDFDLRPPYARKARGIFGGNFSIGDFKIGSGISSRNSMAGKIAKELVTNGPGRRFIMHGGKPGKATGFVPNFSPITDAIGREMAAGVPSSAIRVGTSPALRGAGNPGGVGVYNTIHEPAGLAQGISRSRSSGVNPRSHGVPNFAGGSGITILGPSGKPLDLLGIRRSAAAASYSRAPQPFGPRPHGPSGVKIDLSKGIKVLPSSAQKAQLKEMKMMRGMMAGTMVHMAAGAVASAAGPTSAVGKGAHVVGNMASGAGMGAMVGGGIPGAIIGGILGLGMALMTMPEATDKATKKIKGQTKAAETLAETTQRVTEALKEAGGSMSGLGLIGQRQGAIKEVRASGEFGLVSGTEEFKSLQNAKTTKQINTALSAIGKRAEGKKRVAALGKSIAGIEGGRKGTIMGARRQIGFENLSAAVEGRESNVNKPSVIPGIGTLSSSQERLNKALGVGAGGNLLKKNLGLDIKNYYRNMAGGGGNLSDLQDAGFALGQGSNVSLEKILGAITGEKAEDLGGEAERIRALIVSSGEDLQLFKSRLVENFSSLDELSKAERELADIEAARQAEIKEIVDANKPYIDSIIDARRELVNLGQAMAVSYATTMQDIQARKQLIGMNQQISKARQSATSTNRELIDLDKNQGRRRARQERDLSYEAATATRAFDLAQGQTSTGVAAAKKLLGLFGEGKLAGKGAAGRHDAFMSQSKTKVKTLMDKVANAKTPEEAQRILGEMDDRRGALLAQSSGVASNLAPDLAAELVAIEAVIPKIEEATGKEAKARALAAGKAEDDAKMANKRYKLAVELYNNQYKLNVLQRQVDRVRNARLKGLELEEARGLRAKGQIGAKGFGAAYSASLAGDVAARGVQKGDFGRAFKAGFVNEMGYDPKDMLDDWESGTRSVAQNMKSSFADAFQSISSGADSVQGALANMAQSILNSISQISTNMMTNIMFSKMGWTGSQGGLVPGYAGGGVVTGGSGYKDDVPTMMQGGEFVIKKSSAQKIGYGNLNAINGIGKGYAEGGPSMGQLGLVAAGASAASGLIGAAMQPGAPKPLPSRDYGLGRGKYGHFGGADPDAGHVDTVTGGGGRAGVSLGKAFVYYRRDPETGRLISERARPTEGRFEVSRGLSLMGRLGEDDPQTGRMFGKEQTMAKYQDYLATETQSRKDQIAAVKRQKRQRLIGAYVNAAMMIGGAKLMSGGTPGPPDVTGPGGQTYSAFEGSGGTAYRLSDAETFTQFSRPLSQPGVVGTMQNLQTFNPLTGGMAPRLDIGGDPRGGANGGMARVMGGEYIMSPDTVRTYGTNFMHELNRGNVPGYANGGPVGGTSAGNQGPNSETLIGGNTTNNVRISVNIDKAGKADASADTGSEGGGEREDNEQANQSKEFSKILQGVVLDEIVKQQRPGGLLQGSPHAP